MWPSGKAPGFGPGIRGFESLHPSHPIDRCDSILIMNIIQGWRERRDARKAERQAEYDAWLEEQRVALLQEKRNRETPVLNELEQYAGRLVLVTNPSDNSRDIDRLHNPIAEAIHRAMSADTDYRFSLHAGTSPNSGQGIATGTQFIVDRLSELTSGNVTYTGALQSLGRLSTLTPFALKQVLEVSTFGPFMDTSPKLTHVAVTSALGIDGVNLDYSWAKYGDSFVYRGVNENGDMQWDKIYSAVGIPGSHHIN